MNSVLKDVNKLRKCETLEEFFRKIPKSFYEKCSLLLMLYWAISPIIVITISMITKERADIELSSMVYEIGYIGLILGAFLLIRSISLKEYNKKNYSTKEYIKNNIHHILLLLMLTYSLIASINANNTVLSFYGDNFRREGFFRYLSYAGFYISALNLKNEKYKKIFYYVLVGVSTILSILTILQFYELRVSVLSMYITYAGIFNALNHFGYYLTITTVIVAILCVQETNKYLKALCYFQYSLMIMAMIINNTFATYIAVLMGLIFLIIGYFIKGEKNRKYFIPLIIFTFISIVMNSLYGGLIGENFSILSSDTKKIMMMSDDRGRAGSDRWMLWVSGIDFVKEKPLLGYGPDNLEEEYRKIGIYQSRPHNEYLQHAVCLGIPALLLYLSALFNIFIRNFKRRKILNEGNIIALVATFAYLASAFFGNTMYYTAPYFFIILAIAAQLSNLKEHI
ncbi:O-Antigen ligase [Clostridium collagenovorans DSM 3089]|uniref:O-Antigen ligase n=1 Tax=Clostridium collagenovorans DSM 3089 TaxID=1121306 RepID=A0A1M5SJT6_9CLOT|nr:O-antigen ligase family protein [Clostridium collagenovorans]SHH38725.1 O-Antigen ligase [Clostridium collagenovorans DSM 3089]